MSEGKIEILEEDEYMTQIIICIVSQWMTLCKFMWMVLFINWMTDFMRIGG